MVAELLPGRGDPAIAGGLDLAVRFLHAEIAAMRAAGVPVGEDDYRGLYIAEREVDRLLAATPAPTNGRAPHHTNLADLRDELAAITASAGGRLQRVIDFGPLGPFEVGCLLLCLATEADPQVERLLAYAQDDVTRRRPRVELLLRLFAGGHAERDALLPAAPLLHHRLVRLLDEPGQPFTPLSARYVALDARIAEYLLGSDAFCEPLAGCVRIGGDNAGARALLPSELRAALTVLAEGGTERPRTVALRGNDSVLIGHAAGAFAVAFGRRVLAVSTAPLTAETGIEAAIALALREAALQDAVPLFEAIDALEPADRALLATLLDAQAVVPAAVAAFADAPGWPGFTVDVADLDYDRRRALWAEAAPGSGPASGDLEAVAAKFRLGVEEIRRAGQFAATTARWRDGAAGRPGPEDLYAAARSQSTPILSGLARKVAPHYRWDDLVLPPDALDQLHEIAAQVTHRHRVYEQWGFERKLSLSHGVIALFAGNSGTGKTMAADVMANTLGLDLYRIDLSAVVSKYIGETEKNLDSIFREAERSNAVLFFDEADALFGKRSEVKDAHDRYANIETAYLLQRMEEYGGIVILATNLKMNLDDAFVRRLHYVVDFPMPDEAYRRRIWEGAIPPEAPLADDVDWAFLARQFRISGGNIRNAVVAAAFLAAGEERPIAMAHFIRGIRREYQKLGRMVTEAEFGPYTVLLQ